MAPYPIPSRGVTSTQAGSGGSYASISRIASSHAYRVSMARTMMLRNGLVQVAPSPAARAAAITVAGSRPEFRLYRAMGPTR